VAPVAAAAAGVLLGGPAPRPLVWAGIAVVAAGLALGLRTNPRRLPPTPYPDRSPFIVVDPGFAVDRLCSGTTNPPPGPDQPREWGGRGY